MYTRKEDKGVQIPPLEAFAIFLVNAFWKLKTCLHRVPASHIRAVGWVLVNNTYPRDIPKPYYRQLLTLIGVRYSDVGAFALAAVADL